MRDSEQPPARAVASVRFLAAIVTSGHGKDGGTNLNAGVTVASLLPTPGPDSARAVASCTGKLAAKSSCLSARVPNAGGDAQARASARKSRQDSDGRPAAELELRAPGPIVIVLPQYGKY